MDVILFVPGFFGFGAFGHPDRPFIEYFAHVEDAMLRAHVGSAHFVVHQPPPAASLAERARSLHEKERLAATSNGRCATNAGTRSHALPS